MSLLKAIWSRVRPQTRRRRLFLCYRRADTEGTTGHLHSRLARWYGARHVFRDRESIEAGDEWPERIQNQLARSDVVLVVIGRNWITPRLNDEDDWVRQEIETALADDEKTVVPLLVENAELPGTELPESLRPLLSRQVSELRPERFKDDVRKLIDDIGGARFPRFLEVSLATWAVGVVVVGGLLGSYFALKPTPEPEITNPEPEITKMTGQMNIAVAEFAAEAPEGEVAPVDNARSLADSVYRFLADQADEFRELSNDDIQIRAPADTGPISGNDRESRAEAARQLAENINADLVLYGVLTIDGRRTSFTPEFILTDRILGGAEELLGHYELGAPVEPPGSPDDAQKAIVLNLEARTVAFARFVIGLTHYRVADFEAARQYFNEALVEQVAPGKAAWLDEDGKEVLYLFLGNAAGKAKEYDEADANYRKALELNDEYARAHIGLGEVARVRSGCVSRASLDDLDDALMEDAYAEYETAETAAFRPAVSEIDAKAALGKGRIHACRSLDGGDEWVEAQQQFRKVLAAYRPPGSEQVNSRIDELAADAYFELGFAMAAAPGAELADYLAAIPEFEQALELEEELRTDDNRRALVNGWLGWLNGQVGNLDSARTHCQSANEVNPVTDIVAQARADFCRAIIPG